MGVGWAAVAAAGVAAEAGAGGGSGASADGASAAAAASRRPRPMGSARGADDPGSCIRGVNDGRDAGGLGRAAGEVRGRPAAVGGGSAARPSARTVQRDARRVFPH
ncbi:hypothetical protein BU14_0289s0012 [Porphyra umbilicalis]|uniref:Uncharacterized protein n=1 Tax=Porphyra umbilicalis TaxID=2786 RepID=A0A1X6P1C7_PORUM|nr:hypothetical protein BU14_0289s0012 [Porphyra umbilicalis]|eukprot:OSX74433.1 hypothetical protein BU14_0289s0012 [Porphyra umbilicalis]